MRDTLLEILEEIAPTVDFENCKTLIDDHKLDSLAILSLIAELEDALDITLPTVEIVPANFNSVDAMAAMIERLEAED